MNAQPSPSAFLPFAAVDAATCHLGLDDLPFVPVSEGVELQLLQVDLKQGLWINRTRLQPGARVAPHFHTGAVFAVTLQGSWFYEETPAQANSAGSYLFEPAGSTHTLMTPPEQTGPTLVWFAIYGANLNVGAGGHVELVLDARAMLGLYQHLCAERGLNTKRVILT